jgi:hypothetical protein
MPFRDAADQAVDLLTGVQAPSQPDLPLPDPDGQRALAE